MGSTDWKVKVPRLASMPPFVVLDPDDLEVAPRRRPDLDPDLLTAAKRAAIPLLADLGLGPDDD